MTEAIALKSPTRVTKTLNVDGATALGGTLAVTGASTFTEAATFNGALTFTTPIGVANVNTSIKRQTIPLNFKGGDVLTDGVTYVLSIPMTRAGTVRAINISAHTKIVGGTNTLAFAKKNAATSVSLISTATVDPTAVPAAADVAEALTLTSTGADLAFVSGDCLKATLVCGTMTTDGQGYAVSISVEYTDV